MVLELANEKNSTYNILIVILISSAHAYSQFCNGFEAGYAVGYKQKKIQI